VRLLSKVVWSEGMYLGPHHLQAQNSYFENLTQFALGAVWFEPYGLIDYQLDSDALLNGTVSLIKAQGIFADGLPFHMPEFDALPEPLRIAELFSPVDDSLPVWLAVPAVRAGGLNCAASSESANQHVRYTAVERSLYDETTGQDERKVRLGSKNIRLVAGTEPGLDQVVLPLARVVRDGSGHYVYDPLFIPPCLKIESSERLMSVTRRLVDILQEKSSGLAQSDWGSAGQAAGYSARQVLTFWYLHCINSALATLRHLCFTKRGHPEELFGELSRLGGALCTFRLESHPSSLPVYDHTNLGKCFEHLDRHIREHLEALLPTNYVTIPLKSLQPNFYGGKIVDQRCLDRARWILGVRASVGEVELTALVPQVVKVCAAQHIRRLVEHAFSGLTLKHLPVPPAAVSKGPDFQYFVIDRSGPCWEGIVQSRTVGIHVPDQLPKPELDLTVLLEA